MKYAGDHANLQFFAHGNIDLAEKSIIGLSTCWETEMTSKSVLGLSAVETMPVHERVYHSIVKALMSGQFEPDQKLTSRKLA